MSKQQWPDSNFPAVPTGATTSEPTGAVGSARLAVLGDPILHSKSPQLHMAAYRALGLDWEYFRWQVPAGNLNEALSTRGQGWRGVSVTAPLKSEALSFAVHQDAFATQTAAVNTLVFDALDPNACARGFNTDVYGIIEAFSEVGCDRVSTAQIIGSGDTAASAAVAAIAMGATHIEIAARRPEAAKTLAESLASRTTESVEFTAVPLSTGSRNDWQPHSDIIIDTVPGGVPISVASLAHDATTVLSAAYDPWPTQFAASMQRLGAQVISGEAMLLHQAVYQVRLFTGRAVDEALPNESAVVAAMRAELQ